MKRLVGIAMGILFLGVMAFTFNGSAFAAPGHGGHGRHGGHGIHRGHGHGGHHRPHGIRHSRHHRFHGPGIYWGSVWADTDCYWVRRCHTNPFGILRCRRVQICD